MIHFLRLSVCAAALFGAACASDPTGSDAGGGSGGALGSAGSNSAGKGEVTEAKCPAPNPQAEPRPVTVGLVSGQVLDEQGEPTSSGLVQICGKDICINARVGDNGKLAEAVDQELDDPACKFGDGLSWAKLAIPLAAGDSKLGTLTTVRLPDFADGVPFTPGETSSSGGVTLTLTADAHVEVDTLTYEDDTQRGFRAVALPEAALLPLEHDFVAGYALSPVDTRICPSPALSLENAANLPPGTELELFVLGVDVSEVVVPYGDWTKVGEGQVSDDAATLEFESGLPLLTAIGIREKR